MTLPADMPSEFNLLILDGSEGTIKVIFPSEPTSNSGNLVTTGVTSIFNFLQHSPRGMSFP